MWGMRIKIKKKMQSKGGKLSKLFPRVFFRCELRMDSSHFRVKSGRFTLSVKHTAMETRKGGQLVLPRVIWEGFREEVTF